MVSNPYPITNTKVFRGKANGIVFLIPSLKLPLVQMVSKIEVKKQQQINNGISAGAVSPPE